MSNVGCVGFKVFHKLSYRTLYRKDSKTPPILHTLHAGASAQEAQPRTRELFCFPLRDSRGARIKRAQRRPGDCLCRAARRFAVELRDSLDEDVSLRVSVLFFNTHLIATCSL